MTNMTNKEAIDRLNELLLCTSLLSDADHEAMRKGIKALEEVGEWHKLKLVCANEGIVVYKIRGKEE